MADDKAGSTDNVEIALRGPDGKVKQQEKCHNLITTVGRNAIVERLGLIAGHVPADAHGDRDRSDRGGGG